MLQYRVVYYVSKVSIDEFVNGFMSLKGGAMSLDVHKATAWNIPITYTHTTCKLCVCMCVYIYIERERYIHMRVYIMYISLSLYIYIYTWNKTTWTHPPLSITQANIHNLNTSTRITRKTHKGRTNPQTHEQLDNYWFGQVWCSSRFQWTFDFVQTASCPVVYAYVEFSCPNYARRVAGAANLRTKILDFGGFDSSTILNLRGGILTFPGNLESTNLSRDHLYVDLTISSPSIISRTTLELQNKTMNFTPLARLRCVYQTISELSGPTICRKVNV